MIEKPYVIITGGSGLLGSEIVYQTLNNTPYSVVCFVRPNKNRTSADRLSALFGGEFVGRFKDRLQVLSGDIREPFYGLDEATFKLVFSKAECIFHAAACTYFTRKKILREVNVLSLRRFARDLRSIQIRSPFIFLGSAASVGGIQNSEVLENEALSLQSEHYVPYTASKRDAELVLREFSNDIPIVTLRPSMVFPDTKLSEKLAIEAAWALILCATCPGIPLDENNYFDAIPLSYFGSIVPSIIHNKSCLIDSTMHISAGYQRRSFWSDVLDCLEPLSQKRQRIRCLTAGQWNEYKSTQNRYRERELTLMEIYFPFIRQNVVYRPDVVTQISFNQHLTYKNIKSYLPEILASARQQFDQSGFSLGKMV